MACQACGFHCLDAQILARSVQVLAAKKIVADISNKEIDSSVINHTCKVISELRMSDEGKEGVSAFLEKRDPNW